jgi:hypothetical protein
MSAGAPARDSIGSPVSARSGIPRGTPAWDAGWTSGAPAGAAFHLPSRLPVRLGSLPPVPDSPWSAGLRLAVRLGSAPTGFRFAFGAISPVRDSPWPAGAPAPDSPGSRVSGRSDFHMERRTATPDDVRGASGSCVPFLPCPTPGSPWLGSTRVPDRVGPLATGSRLALVRLHRPRFAFGALPPARDSRWPVGRPLAIRWAYGCQSAPLLHRERRLGTPGGRQERQRELRSTRAPWPFRLPIGLGPQNSRRATRPWPQRPCDSVTGASVARGSTWNAGRDPGWSQAASGSCVPRYSRFALARRARPATRWLRSASAVRCSTSNAGPGSRTESGPPAQAAFHASPGSPWPVGLRLAARWVTGASAVRCSTSIAGSGSWMSRDRQRKLRSTLVPVCFGPQARLAARWVTSASAVQCSTSDAGPGSWMQSALGALEFAGAALGRPGQGHQRKLRSTLVPVCPGPQTRLATRWVTGTSAVRCSTWNARDLEWSQGRQKKLHSTLVPVCPGPQGPPCDSVGQGCQRGPVSHVERRPGIPMESGMPAEPAFHASPGLPLPAGLRLAARWVTGVSAVRCSTSSAGSGSWMESRPGRARSSRRGARPRSGAPAEPAFHASPGLPWPAEPGVATRWLTGASAVRFHVERRTGIPMESAAPAEPAFDASPGLPWPAGPRFVARWVTGCQRGPVFHVERRLGTLDGVRPGRVRSSWRGARPPRSGAPAEAAFHASPVCPGPQSPASQFGGVTGASAVPCPTWNAGPGFRMESGAARGSCVPR